MREHESPALAPIKTAKAPATQPLPLMAALTPPTVLALQRTAGNAAVTSMLARAPAGDGGTTADAGTPQAAPKPSYDTPDLRLKMTATVLAEAAESQVPMVVWVYYNRVTKKKGLKGLNGSTAYRDKNAWYRVWLHMAGDHRDAKVKLDPARFNGAKSVEEFATENEFMKSQGARRTAAAAAAVDSAFDMPGANPIAGWTGQGSIDDLNEQTSGPQPKPNPHLQFRQARAYWHLQRTDPKLARYVELMWAGRHSTVVFDETAIAAYFKDHELPKDVPPLTPPP